MDVLRVGMRVLIVEDNERLGGLLLQMLEREGIAADWARDADEAFAFVDYNRECLYDVVVLDWMLPGKSGPEICAALRDPTRYHYHGGVLFLTARDALEDRILGLDSGGDDYLVKPFENTELVARLRALDRRKSRPYVDQVVALAGVSLDRNEHQAFFQGREIRLSAKEFEVFELLLLNIGKTLPRGTIIAKIWGEESDVTSANLDSHIYLLRKKLKPLENFFRVKLTRGVGYKIEKIAE